MKQEELIKLITEYVAEHIGEFHQNRIKKLQSIKINDLLKKKNPYLYRAKNINNSCDMVKSLAVAFVSSAEETIFGDWLEGLAIYVNRLVYGGRKSSSEGIDLEFDKEGIRYLVTIKSGPKWSNSSSLAKMKDHFAKAKRIIKTSGSKINVEAVNGCCYGKEDNAYKAKGDYYKYCGEEFWTFISGVPTLYKDIVEPLATNAKKSNEEYEKEYNKMITKLNCKFVSDYCNAATGEINWSKIIELNSKKKVKKGK